MAKRYPKELRERAVRVALERLDDQNTPYQVAADLAPKLGVKKESLRRWIIQAQIDGGNRAGLTTIEQEEIKALKRQVRDLEEANEILKAASIFFAGELDPRRQR